MRGIWADREPKCYVYNRCMTTSREPTAAEKRKATIAARKVRPQAIDVMARVSSNAALWGDDPTVLPGVLADLAAVAGKVPDAEWDEWIRNLRAGEAGLRAMRLRVEALRDGEALPECQHCGESFAGRSDARYCSTRCRVAAHRAKGAR